MLLCDAFATVDVVGVVMVLRKLPLTAAAGGTMFVAVAKDPRLKLFDENDTEIDAEDETLLMALAAAAAAAFMFKMLARFAPKDEKEDEDGT